MSHAVRASRRQTISQCHILEVPSEIIITSLHKYAQSIYMYIDIYSYMCIGVSVKRFGNTKGERGP